MPSVTCGTLAHKHFSVYITFHSFAAEDSHFISNQAIFEDIGKEIMENAWDGFNCSVFAYGQTGSGKVISPPFFLRPSPPNTLEASLISLCVFVLTVIQYDGSPGR